MALTAHDIDAEPSAFPAGEAVAVSALPVCDICVHVERLDIGAQRALFDGRTVFGQWAYMCLEHMNNHGVGLGTGFGQRLVIPGIGQSVSRHPAGKGIRS